MKEVKEILTRPFKFTDGISISLFDVLVILGVIFITSIVLRILLKIITRRMPAPEKDKFRAVFSYFKWIIYIIIFLITLHSVGVKVTAVFAASAALLIGVGLALQTLFQDIISGVFILIDQSLHVGDIIEMDGKVGRVEEIKLRTTRAVTFDNKVLIIPNHLYLTNSLYNWTQNGKTTRENVEVSVAYGSDLDKVKSLLLEAAKSSDAVYDYPEPVVLFTNFGDSALDFKLVFTLGDSFGAGLPKSDIRFKINELFKENNIEIPFPQREMRILGQN